MKVFISSIHKLTQCLALLILHWALAGSTLLAAEESSILKIELRGEYKSLERSLDTAQLNCTEATSPKGKGKDFSETLNKLGLKIQFSSDCTTVKVSAEHHLEALNGESKTQGIIVLTFPHEVELEGVSSRSMQVVSTSVKIPSHWSSQSLVISSRMGEKPTFINQGSVQVSQLKLGDLLHPLARVQNDGGGSIEVQEISGVVSEFQNLGRIESQKAIKLFGRNFQNSSGSITAEEEMTLNYETFKTQKGSIFGSKITTLHISGSLDNQDGIIGSGSSTTELDFASTGFASHLGMIHGAEVHLTLNHSSPVQLALGSIHAESSISLFSPVKVFLPSVSFHTPLLNLSLPDFQIEPLTQCNTTVIHCNPEKNFCLTSDFRSQGEVRFLESDYCRTRTQQEKEEAYKNSEPSNLEAQVSQALASLRTQAHHSELIVTNKTQELIQKSKEMEIYFQQDHGNHSTYQVGINAQLSADQGLHMLLPEGKIVLGRDSNEKEIGIYTSNLLIRANFYQQFSGTVSAEKALLSVPSGMDLGFLEKDEAATVKVGDQEFPLYKRGNTLWTTQGDCLIRGPFRCSGTLDIGGNLILDSDKRQYSNSPDIHVHGDLIFKGTGDIEFARHVGQTWYDSETKSDQPHYSELERIRVDGKTIPESPKKIELIATRFYADENGGPSLSFSRKDVHTDKPVEFPGEEAKKDFITEISTRKQGFLRLEGPKSEGIISTEEVYLLEDEGQISLVIKNPYYIPPKDPLHKLSLSSHEQRSPKVYHERNLQDRSQESLQASSSSFEWREKSFFSPAESQEWIDSISEDIVVFEQGVGISSLNAVKAFTSRDPGRAVFELSPKVLLSQVQKAVSDTLKRSYIDGDQSLDLDYLRIVHQNTTLLLRSAGITWEPRSQSAPISSKHVEEILNQPQLLTKLDKPLLFYRIETNAEGVRILKPELILPSSLLEKVRSTQQDGNIFGKVLGTFYAGATVEQMLANIDAGTPNGDKLRAVLNQNQTIIAQINDSARRYEEQLEQTPDFKRHRDDWNIEQKLKSQNISILRRDSITVSSDQVGGDVDFVSLTGDAKILSKKKVQSEQADPNQEEIEKRKLKYTGHFNLRAGRHIETQAIDLEADSGEIEARGGILDHTIALQSAQATKGKGYSKSTESIQHQTSHFKVKDGFRIKGDKVYLVGSLVEAGTIQLEAKEELEVLGVNDTEQTNESREEETGFWFWKGKKTETSQSSTSTFKAAQLKATETVDIKAKEVTLQAPEVHAQETEVEADTVKIKLGKNIKKSGYSKSSQNAFWISQEIDQRSDETHTQLSTLGKIKIKANKLELEEAQGQALKFIEQLEYDSEKLELVRNILEEIHTHQHDSISAPGPALIAAIAIAASIGTAGVGVAVVGTAGTAVTAAASAAISSLSAQIVSQLMIGILAQQNPGEIMGKIFNTDTLKNMVTATVSAGALYEVGCLQNAAGTCVPLKHLENAGVQAGVGITADVAFGDKNLGDALTSGGIQFTSQFLSSTAASEIGDHFRDKHSATDRILHKAAHGIAAAGVAAGGAALTGQDVGVAAAAGAAGAMTAEVVADILSKPLNEEIYKDVQNQQTELGRELTQDEKQGIFSAKVGKIALISKLSGAVSGLMASGEQGLNAGRLYAGNAIDNNFWTTAVPVLLTGYMLYEWEQSNVVTDDAIVSDPLGEAALLGGVAAGAKGIAKGAQKLGPMLFKAGKGLVKAAQESEIIGNEVGAIGDVVQGGTEGVSKNRAAFEEYKTQLRKKMGKPYVGDPELAEIIERQYRPNAEVGSGSTAAAIREELSTGLPVKGKRHIQKGREDLGSLKAWLNNNPTVSHGDRAAAENVIKDLEHALRGAKK